MLTSLDFTSEIYFQDSLHAEKQLFPASGHAYALKMEEQRCGNPLPVNALHKNDENAIPYFELAAFFIVFFIIIIR